MSLYVVEFEHSVVRVVCEIRLGINTVHCVEISNAIIDERVLTNTRVRYCLCRRVVSQVYILSRPGDVNSYCFCVGGNWCIRCVHVSPPELLSRASNVLVCDERHACNGLAVWYSKTRA